MNQEFKLQDTLKIIAVTLLGVISSVVFTIPLFWGFIPGFLYLVRICLNKGIDIEKIKSFSVKGFLKTKDVMIILMLVGVLLPVWEMAGTIDGMVTVMLNFISIDYFYVSAFLSTLVISMLLGTCVGSLSVIGIPIIGAAMTLGMSPEFTAGALISGAFVGDRTSPFSSANQLLSNTLEIYRKVFQKSISTTAVIGIVLSLIFYITLDTNQHVGYTTYSPNNNEITSYVFVLPILALLTLTLTNVNIKTSFIVSILTACVIVVMKDDIQLDFSTIWNGTIESGGGMKKMIPLVAFIGLAGAYNGIVEELKLFSNLLSKWLGKTTGLFTMTWKTIIATLFITLIASNQTLPIILTGRTFLKEWDTHHSKEQLARVMADSSMLFAGMVPWSVLAIMCSTVLGIPLFQYLPFAIFLWSLPFITLLVSIISKNRVVLSSKNSSIS